MKQYLALVAVLVIGACGKQDNAAPAADTTATAAPAHSMPGMQHDSTMVRDTASN